MRELVERELDSVKKGTKERKGSFLFKEDEIKWKSWNEKLTCDEQNFMRKKLLFFVFVNSMLILEKNCFSTSISVFYKLPRYLMESGRFGDFDASCSWSTRWTWRTFALFVHVKNEMRKIWIHLRHLRARDQWECSEKVVTTRSDHKSHTTAEMPMTLHLHISQSGIV